MATDSGTSASENRYTARMFSADESRTDTSSGVCGAALIESTNSNGTLLAASTSSGGKSKYCRGLPRGQSSHANAVPACCGDVDGSAAGSSSASAADRY